MKMQLAVSKERYDELKAALEDRGITVDDDAELVLTERSRFPDRLTVKGEDGSLVLLPVEEIVLIETCGRAVEVHTETGTYQTRDRLYQMERLLDPAAFLRISSGVIIAKRKVRRITPALSMKFTLTMVGGRTADVTRSYYYIFRDAFGI